MTRPNRAPVDTEREASKVESRLKYFLWLFTLLFVVNIIVTNNLASDIFSRTSRYAAVEGHLPEAEVARMHEEVGKRARGLMILNFPAVINIGLAARNTPPRLGIGYYPTIVLGASYVPFLFVFVLFFLVHSPKRYGTMPGVELD